MWYKPIHACLASPPRCDSCRSTREKQLREGLCHCFRLISYERLAELDTGEKDPVVITFYADVDQMRGVDVKVEQQHSATNIIDIIRSKMNIKNKLHWTLVEFWMDKDFHRTLEDHESVLDVYYRTMQHANMSNIIYIYRQKLFQYEFFMDPTNVFKNVNFVIEDRRFDLVSLDRILSHMYEADMLPPVFGRVGIRQNGRWYKVFLLLRNGILYMTRHSRNMKMWILNSDEKIMTRRYLEPRTATDEDLAGLNEIGPISFFDIYSGNQTLIDPSELIPNVFFQQKYEKSKLFALRPSLCENVKSSKKSIYRFTCYSVHQRQAWVAAMRLAKYGKLLRDNYRAYKEKHSEGSCSLRDYSTKELPRSHGEDAVMGLVVFHRDGRSIDSVSTPEVPEVTGPATSKMARRLRARKRVIEGLESEEEESTLTKCLVPLMSSLRFLDNSSPERSPVRRVQVNREMPPMRGVEVNLEMAPMRGVEVEVEMPPEEAIRDQPGTSSEVIDDQPGPSSRRRIYYDKPSTSSQMMDSRPGPSSGVIDVQPGPSSRRRFHYDQPGTSSQMMDCRPGPSSGVIDVQPGPSSLGRIHYDNSSTSSQMMDSRPGPSSEEHIYDRLRPSSKIIEIKPKKSSSRCARDHPMPSTSKTVDAHYRKSSSRCARDDPTPSTSKTVDAHYGKREKFGSMRRLLRSFDSPESESTQSDEDAFHILVSPDSSILERSSDEEEPDFAMLGPRGEFYGNFHGRRPRKKKPERK